MLGSFKGPQLKTELLMKEADLTCGVLQGCLPDVLHALECRRPRAKKCIAFKHLFISFTALTEVKKLLE